MVKNKFIHVGPRSNVVLGDCLEVMRRFSTDAFDLTFCSPPYEDARDYGVGFKLKGQDWVDWLVPRVVEMVRVTKGLVAVVVEGKTRNFKWSGTPVLLMADLIRLGITLRHPCAYKRHGVAGSGGPDYWKNLFEFVVVCSKNGRLPYSDNTANGHPPKFKPGGRPSNRKANGERTSGRDYKPPALANAGNIIDCGPAGGGRIGSKLAHENEAPFPEQLVAPFIKCFCPPDGIVFDPFVGSGTTLAVAESLGRKGLGIDCRQSQIDLTRQRLAEQAANQFASGSAAATQSTPARAAKRRLSRHK